MTFLQFCFYFFAATLIFAAGMVVTVRNPVKAALCLVLAFFSAACVWITLEAEFLAIVLVLVYVGAVMVLFLFVVMMLDINLEELRAGFTHYLPFGTVVAVLLAAEIVLVLIQSFSGADFAAPPARDPDYSNTRELGAQLYTTYVYAFEIAALILLVAIVAAILLTMRTRRGSKNIAPAKQVSTRREDRLRIVKMTPGKIQTDPTKPEPPNSAQPKSHATSEGGEAS